MFLHLAVAAAPAPAYVGPACKPHRADHRYLGTPGGDAQRGYSADGGFSIVYLPSK